MHYLEREYDISYYIDMYTYVCLQYILYCTFGWLVGYVNAKSHKHTRTKNGCRNHDFFFFARLPLTFLLGLSLPADEDDADDEDEEGDDGRGDDGHDHYDVRVPHALQQANP